MVNFSYTYTNMNSSESDHITDILTYFEISWEIKLSYTVQKIFLVTGVNSVVRARIAVTISIRISNVNN